MAVVWIIVGVVVAVIVLYGLYAWWASTWDRNE